MTNETITTTAALRACFAFSPSILPLNTHATNAAYDPERTALKLLDAALAKMIDALPADDQRIMNMIADDFHADPFYHLDIDADADDDAPITTDDIRAFINDELEYARANPSEYLDNDDD